MRRGGKRVKTSRGPLAGLKPRHRTFVSAYCGLGGEPHGERWNATAAARKAGYVHPEVRGCELLRREDVRAAVDHVLARRRIGDLDIAERVVEELVAVALGDIGDVGPFLRGEVELEDLPPRTRAAISEVTETLHGDGTRTRKVKLHPKVQASVVLLRALEARQPKHESVEPPSVPCVPVTGRVVDVRAVEKPSRRGLTQEQAMRAREALGIAPPFETRETPPDERG